ncbi:MAG: twin-arginine translocation signal domain-containing protein, partial [Burkholderiales bacterium]
MLLTRKANASATSHRTSAVQQNRLSQGLSSVLAKTMDRRTFLKRTGVTAGAGAAFVTSATQLPFSMMGKAEAAAETGKIEVKRTVCTH